MTKLEYSKRINSNSWRTFAMKCRTLVGNMCQMCGASGFHHHVHHMRYGHLDTILEWLDLVVLCEPCHNAWHRVVKSHPASSESRKDLLFELEGVLSSSGVNTSFFKTHGREMSNFWVANPKCVGVGNTSMLVYRDQRYYKGQPKKEPSLRQNLTKAERNEKRQLKKAAKAEARARKRQRKLAFLNANPEEKAKLIAESKNAAFMRMLASQP